MPKVPSNAAVWPVWDGNLYEPILDELAPVVEHQVEKLRDGCALAKVHERQCRIVTTVKVLGLRLIQEMIHEPSVTGPLDVPTRAREGCLLVSHQRQMPRQGLARFDVG